MKSERVCVQKGFLAEALMALSAVCFFVTLQGFASHRAFYVLLEVDS